MHKERLWGVILLILVAASAGAQNFDDWSAPQAVTGINSTFADTHPSIAADGQAVFFNTDRFRTPNRGGRDLWCATWDEDAQVWSAVNLWPINTAAHEENPAIAMDGHRLFFASNRESATNFDIYLVRRPNKKRCDLWQTPVNLGSGVNSSAEDTSPAFYEDDDSGDGFLYFASRRSTTDLDIYVSGLLADDTFGSATAVAAVNSSCNEDGPMVSANGLELFFSRNCQNEQAGEIWVSRRASTHDVWGEPVPLPSWINTISNEVGPSLSHDGTQLWFARACRPSITAPLVAYDLFVVTRPKESVPGTQ